jgi:hypothetical protein
MPISHNDNLRILRVKNTISCGGIFLPTGYIVPAQKSVSRKIYLEIPLALPAANLTFSEWLQLKF